MRVAFALLTFTALAATHSAADEIDGAYDLVPLVPAYTDLLTAALKSTSFSESVGSMRVCWSDVISVKAQVVAGINYMLDINGCNVLMSEGKCSNVTLASCTPSPYQVVIFEQSWTNTLELSSITKVDTIKGSCHQTNPIAPNQAKNPMCSCQQPSAEEETLLKHWLEAMGLDDYGYDTSYSWLAGYPHNINGCSPSESVKMLYSDHPWLPSAVVEDADCDRIEKSQILAWFKLNGLDKYGNAIGTYESTSPLFDPRTNTMMTLCVYTRFYKGPNFPWLIRKMATP
ncbi:hypothetical protein KXD40_003042 [Peronospora effusa]|uniref:SCP domain-containing protein n=1 Tax=Peronospora effusa TaxID=542832 RepID=A0A3M6VPM3_9STRA|nr:hypothetical protein DD238_006264 [Peronospora effusa]RQM11351.1 hypothetical protein DD237_006683 [Peronospora effusa]UIZ29337.1 hypothetical protein KXD40_003042 [Peronospora effusa]CAI5716181.1 unnamed protein product [Peronospora effusa]